MNVLRGINGTLFIVCILLAANYAKHVQHLEKMTWPKFNFDDKETTFVKSTDNLRFHRFQAKDAFTLSLESTNARRPLLEKKICILR